MTSIAGAVSCGRPVVTRGTMLRIHRKPLQEPRTLEGALFAVDPKRQTVSLVLTDDDGTVDVPVAPIESIAVLSARKSPDAGVGVVLGGPSGAGIGAAVGSTQKTTSTSCGRKTTGTQKAADEAREPADAAAGQGAP